MKAMKGAFFCGAEEFFRCYHLDFCAKKEKKKRGKRKATLPGCVISTVTESQTRLVLFSVDLFFA